MNKTKKILAATGVAIVIAVGVAAYFAWSAYSAKTVAMEGDSEEGVEGLETVQAAASGLSGVSGGKIYPCLASVKGVESNTETIVAWRDEAAKLAARGDRPVRVTTPAQFKSDIVEEAKRIAALPGVANGKLVKSDFAFGPFKPYVAEGQMPSESKLAELTRRWDDVVTVVEMLVASGVTELLDIQFKTAADAATEEETAARGRKNRKPVRKTAKAAEKDEGGKPVAHSYVFSFTTRAPGLVKVVNALTTGERFAVIDSLTFVREKDVIAEALGDGEAKAKAQQSGGRRGRRSRRQAEEKQEKEETPKNSIVTDPLLDAPLKAELTVTVYDFRSLETEKAEEKGVAK